MQTFAVLTRLSAEALSQPAAVEKLEKEVAAKLAERCPRAKWLNSFAVLGPCDYLDIFEAPDAEVAAQAALVIRSFGHATTETWLLIPWRRYLELAQGTEASRRRGRRATAS